MLDIRMIERGLAKPGKTKGGLAAAMGVRPGAVSEILAEARLIKASELQPIIDYLELNAVPIMGGSPSTDDRGSKIPTRGNLDEPRLDDRQRPLPGGAERDGSSLKACAESDRVCAADCTSTMGLWPATVIVSATSPIFNSALIGAASIHDQRRLFEVPEHPAVQHRAVLEPRRSALRHDPRESPGLGMRGPWRAPGGSSEGC